MTDLQFIVDLLDLSERDIVRAIIACYLGGQPGAIVGTWKQRKNYGAPPTSGEISALYARSDYRCAKCGGTYRIAIDHIDDNKSNSSPNNLQVLCQTCNRSKRSPNKSSKIDQAITALSTIKELWECSQTITERVVFKRAGIRQGGSVGAKVKVLVHRLNRKHKVDPK